MTPPDDIGGKARGLLWLMEPRDLGFEVPEFTIIETSYYHDFLRQRERRLRSRLEEVVEQFKGKSALVRSSATVSEDSEKFSGAGIYDSVEVLAADLDVSNLLDAAKTVYASVNSERARQYRAECGLGEESMALVIQELIDGPGIVNGVMQSRMQGNGGVIPFFWSRKRGAVVDDEKSDQPIHTMYMRLLGEGFEKGSCEPFFVSDTNIPEHEEDFIEKTLPPLVHELKERYGKEFEAEFCYDLNSETIYLVQIRPLTNIQDNVVVFPEKEPILKGEFVMGSGEYIGPLQTPMGVGEFWREPGHYAFAAYRMPRPAIALKDWYPNYINHTPSKKAIIIGGISKPFLHALTVANEQGLLCVVAGKPLKDTGHVMPIFDIPLDEVGEYVHIVSDGLRGEVYAASEDEAKAFERQMFSQVTYDVSDVFNPEEDEPPDSILWDWNLNITPSDGCVYPAICEDFIRHLMNRVEGIRVESNPPGFWHTLYHRTAEDEVFQIKFKPTRSGPIEISNGRSTFQIMGKENCRKIFQEFADMVRSDDYISGEYK
ncbi:MAG: PEP/pyruvate-binding domain-containing protein [archaeon]